MDVGGGTAHTSLIVHSDLGMTAPVVCIDPVQELLDVAQKNGVITIKASGEEFFATKPDYPLKFILMNGCIHHFTDQDFYFTKLAEYMPDDGMCFLTEYETATTLPFFKLAVEAFSYTIEDFGRLCERIQSKGLYCQMVTDGQPVEIAMV